LFLEGTFVAAWITVVIGSVVGFLWRRLVLAHRDGGFTDMLLGITGAFGATWLLDLLRQYGVNTGPYTFVFVVCGAGLLPWSFSGFERREHKNRPRPHLTAPRAHSPIAESESDSAATRTPAA
jgi:uncharacterized membrane protein YeaQ/YmgE (transglycosylase-associated protein family)